VLTDDFPEPNPESRMLTELADRFDALKPELPELEFTWVGAPTKESLRQLRYEAMCPSWDGARAVEILSRLWEGETLKTICEGTGIRRSTVMWWAELIPEFGEMLGRAVESCGAVMRDEAAEIIRDVEADPARSRAALAVAAAYDRRIAKGEGDVNVAQGITVTVQRFGD